MILVSSATVAALTATVVGTGRGRVASNPNRANEKTIAEPLTREGIKGWRTVKLYEVQTESLTEGGQRLPDLPGGTKLFPSVRGLSAGAGGVQELSASGSSIGSIQSGRTGERRGILDELDGAPDRSPSWGWLADEVSATAIQPEAKRETGLRFLQSDESRLLPQNTDRLGTGLGLGGGEDSFLFQRRQDDRF